MAIMSLLVLSYPIISQEDFDWIQKVRATHDRLHYELVDPHFTIVFAVDNIKPEEFIQHIKQNARGFKKITFVLRCAVVIKDAFSEHSYVFLVPDEGYSEIVKLHDRLYEGQLASELRLDIPFIPHIVAGNSIDPQVCKRLADQLNQQSFVIKGFVEKLDVAEYKNDKVKTIEQIKLV
jgi:hypothetical protein